MARTQNIRGILPAVFKVAVLLSMMPGYAPAQAPRVGDVQRQQVITISMQVGSREKETKQVTYTPPPGWYVRSHSVECIKKTGNSSFSVNTVPQNWDWFSEEKITDSYQCLIEMAGKVNNVGLQGKFRLEQEAMLWELRKARSSHHALTVEATARGEGMWRSGGALELIVTAELVYVGTEMDLRQTVVHHQANLK